MYSKLLLGLYFICRYSHGQTNVKDQPNEFMPLMFSTPGQNGQNTSGSQQGQNNTGIGQSSSSQSYHGMNLNGDPMENGPQTPGNKSYTTTTKPSLYQRIVPAGYNNSHSSIGGIRVSTYGEVSAGMAGPPASWFAGDPFDAARFTAQGPALQWHVGIYDKSFDPYMQICGGTLVSMKAVVSAAHCFWADGFGALPASQFAVGAGKLYRPWNDTHDTLNQKSDVSAIHIPPRYRGASTNFQDDIAVVVLATELTPSPVVRPVCVDFDEDFDELQLGASNMGTIMGWGLTEENGVPSQVLNYLLLPSVNIEECVSNAEPTFLKYITSDKICAGVTTGKALCRGDSGGGLVFYTELTQVSIPYLRGVASTAPRNENLCNAYAIAALTHTSAHRKFLRRHVPGIERECATHYSVVRGIDNGSGKVEERRERAGDRREGEGECACEPARFTCNCFCNTGR